MSYPVESEFDISDHVLRCQQGGEGKKSKWRCQLLRTRTLPGHRVMNDKPSQRRDVALREALTEEALQRRLPTQVLYRMESILICPNLLLPVYLSYSEHEYPVTRHLCLLPSPGFSVSCPRSAVLSSSEHGKTQTFNAETQWSSTHTGF